jgi:hypothetical protein
MMASQSLIDQFAVTVAAAPYLETKDTQGTPKVLPKVIPRMESFLATIRRPVISKVIPGKDPKLIPEVIQKLLKQRGQSIPIVILC